MNPGPNPGFPPVISPLDPVPRRGNVVYVMSVGDLPTTASADRRFLVATNAGSAW